MRFWISRQSEASVREQLVTQILLQISSKELDVGEKLPSTRALARQLGIHANTVSAAYQELSSRGWVELRKGSGAYVAERAARVPLSGELALDQRIQEFLLRARSEGFTLSQVRARVEHWMAVQPPDHVLVIEDVDELREILICEIASVTEASVRGTTQAACRNPAVLVGALPVALYGRSTELPKLLPSDTSCTWLRLRSVRGELLKRVELEPTLRGRGIVVASKWPEFRESGRTMLLAAGVEPEAIHLLDARDDGWAQGLTVDDFVITDAVASTALRPDVRDAGATFKVLSDEALTELRDFGKG